MCMTARATLTLENKRYLIGTVRRELLDQVPFWGAADLERKLLQIRDYYNDDRVHASLDGRTPTCKTVAASAA
jgi:transposase InsO family protein